jgi:prepilin-type N-terminal cleavage/methylation domain-containing protein
VQTLQNGSYKVKTHKGITMIELIIALSILAMAIGVCITNYFKFYDSWTNSTSVDLCNNYILHMIKNSALYCKNKNKSGYLLFSEENKVKFFCGNKKIEEYEIPLEFKFKNTESFYKRININNLGEVLTSCTINYQDKQGELHRITIRVGTRYVQIKNE